MPVQRLSRGNDSKADGAINNRFAGAMSTKPAANLQPVLQLAETLLIALRVFVFAISKVLRRVHIAPVV